jgi:hypothetical protein
MGTWKSGVEFKGFDLYFCWILAPDFWLLFLKFQVSRASNCELDQTRGKTFDYEHEHEHDLSPET